MNRIVNALKTKILLFGLPFDRILKNELEMRLGELIAQYPTDKTPKFATSLSALQIVEMGGILQGQDILSEKTKALLDAGFIGLESLCLPLLAKLLGGTLPEQISPPDLFLATISLLAKNNESVFLLGGNAKQNEAVEKALKRDFPTLRIVGSLSQEIITKGSKLPESMEKDIFLIDHIHSKKPLVLIVQAGIPKQEVWFERVKDMLQVPLVVSVSGVFESYLNIPDGKKKRVSFSIPHAILSLKCFLYFGLRFPQLFLYNTLNRALFVQFAKHLENDIEKTFLFTSESNAFSLVKLPRTISKHSFTKQKTWIDEAFEYDTILFDLENVKHIDLEGLGYLLQLKAFAEKEQKTLLLMRLSKDLEWLLRLHSALAYFQDMVVKTPLEALHRCCLGSFFQGEAEFASIHQNGRDTVITFFGTIRGKEEGPLSFKHLEPLLKERGCIIDLAYSEAITSHGAKFLIELKRFQKKQGETLHLCHLGKHLKRQFKELHLMDLFFG